eukprot:jgi/Botrbrau1/9822/Bobra.0313s0001.1
MTLGEVQALGREGEADLPSQRKPQAGGSAGERDAAPASAPSPLQGVAVPEKEPKADLKQDVPKESKEAAAGVDINREKETPLASSSSPSTYVQESVDGKPVSVTGVKNALEASPLVVGGKAAEDSSLAGKSVAVTGEGPRLSVEETPPASVPPSPFADVEPGPGKVPQGPVERVQASAASGVPQEGVHAEERSKVASEGAPSASVRTEDGAGLPEQAAEGAAKEQSLQTPEAARVGKESEQATPPKAMASPPEISASESPDRLVETPSTAGGVVPGFPPASTSRRKLEKRSSSGIVRALRSVLTPEGRKERKEEKAAKKLAKQASAGTRAMDVAVAVAPPPLSPDATSGPAAAASAGRSGTPPLPSNLIPGEIGPAPLEGERAPVSGAPRSATQSPGENIGGAVGGGAPGKPLLPPTGPSRAGQEATEGSPGGQGVTPAAGQLAAGASVGDKAKPVPKSGAEITAAEPKQAVGAGSRQEAAGPEMGTPRMGVAGAGTAEQRGLVQDQRFPVRSLRRLWEAQDWPLQWAKKRVRSSTRRRLQALSCPQSLGSLNFFLHAQPVSLHLPEGSPQTAAPGMIVEENSESGRQASSAAPAI